MSADRASLEERSILTPDQRLRVFISSTLNELADCLYGFAALALHAGDAEEAAVLVGAADATRERIGYYGSVKHHPATFAAILARAREALGERAFHEAHETGAALGTREAVMRALERFGAPTVP